MCLATVSKRFDPPDPKVRRAWKIVQGNKDDPKRFTSVFNSFLYTPKWAERETTSWAPEGIKLFRHVSYTAADFYPCGFHCFFTKREAQRALKYLRYEMDGGHSKKHYSQCRIVPVLVKGVYVEGIDATDGEKFVALGLRTLVAQWIRLAPRKRALDTPKRTKK